MQYVDKKTVEISLLVSFACMLQIAESMIPHPMPGVRLGLANAVSLIVLVNFGFSSCVLVSVLRAIISSFFLGTFLTPAFLLSFSGALASSAVMGVCYFLFAKKTKLFSIYSISIVGALVHTFSQVFLAYALIIRHKSIFLLVPFLIASSLVTGLITAWVADKLGKKLSFAGQNNKVKLVFKNQSQSVNKCFLNKVRPEIKIAGVLFASLIVILLDNSAAQCVIFAAIISLALILKINILKKSRYMFWFIGFSFVAPFCAFFILNTAGDETAVFLAIVLRVINLFLISYTVNSTTEPFDLNKGISRLFSFLKIRGPKMRRAEQIINIALNLFPVLLRESKSIFSKYKIAGRNKHRIKFKKLMPQLIDDASLAYERTRKIAGY